MFNLTAALLILAMLGCEADTAYFENLAAPMVWWQRSTGLCGETHAVDGKRGVWHEAGCENGRPELDRIGTIAAPAMVELTVKVSSLPLSSADLSLCMGNLHTFGVRETDREWSTATCGSKTVAPSDAASLEEPFRSVAIAFQSLR